MLNSYNLLISKRLSAEKQGFEPWEQLPVHRISSAARSTTPASLQNKKRFLKKIMKALLFSGETGIRTPGTSRYNGFQDRRNRPLCHLSLNCRVSASGFQKRCKGTDYF